MYKLSEAKKRLIEEELQFQYSRSSGPGGQKVNKTETRVEAHWDLLASAAFKGEQKTRIQSKLSSRLTKQGILIFYSEQYRTRPQNRKACIENLMDSLEKALTIPKKRKKTKPTRSSVEKRIKEKKALGEKKRMRGKVPKS